jgi:hypothetical protein
MKHPTAGKDERVQPARAVEDRQFEITVKWGCDYWLPIHPKTMGRIVLTGVDVAQIFHDLSRQAGVSLLRSQSSLWRSAPKFRYYA